MSRTINFTDSVIRNLKNPKKRTIYWCEGSPAFGIRITPTGTKTFIYKYMSGRISRFKTIGQYPKYSIRQARAEYNTLYEQVNDYGKDPIAEEKTRKERERPVEALVDEYIAIGKLKGRKYVVEEERYFRTDILPVIGHKQLHEVTPSDIDQIQKNIIKRSHKRSNATRNGKVTARNVMGCARRLFNLAYTKDLITQNPVHKIEMLGVKGRRDRVLNFKEIWLLWNKIEENGVPPVTASAIKFMLVSMQRGIEVRNMRYSAIKSGEGVWQMETGETKNGKMHRVPLNKHALSLIEDVAPYTKASQYVFGATRATKPSKMPNMHLVPSTPSAYQQAIRRIRKKLSIEDIRPHDLRRTGATWITAVGLPKLYARLLLNHSDGDRDVTGEVYIQYSYDFEKQKAADIWAFILDQIIYCSDIEQVPNLTEMRKAVQNSGLL